MENLNDGDSMAVECRQTKYAINEACYHQTTVWEAGFMKIVGNQSDHGIWLDLPPARRVVCWCHGPGCSLAQARYVIGP